MYKQLLKRREDNNNNMIWIIKWNRIAHEMFFDVMNLSNIYTKKEKKNAGKKLANSSN